MEVIGDAILHLGDCEEILPEIGFVDAVVTDPPYGLGKKWSGGTWGNATMYSVDARKWDNQKISQKLINKLIKFKESIIWGGNYYIMPASRCWLVWDKPAIPTMADIEMAWTSFDKPSKKFVSSRIIDGKKVHPTQKPVALMEWCIGFLENSQTILDPFMGSGTTGIASINLGKKFIGIEREQKYFDIACKRIEQAERQGDLFMQKNNHEQLNLNLK